MSFYYIFNFCERVKKELVRVYSDSILMIEERRFFLDKLSIMSSMKFMLILNDRNNEGLGEVRSWVDLQVCLNSRGIPTTHLISSNSKFGKLKAKMR